MTRTAFDAVTGRASLEGAWRRLYQRTKPSSRNTAGADEVSINDFQQDAKLHLARLHRELVARTYVCSPLKPFLIPKKNKKDRLICVPTVRDRVVQRVLLDFLATKYASVLGNTINFGFLPHRSVKQAVETARNLRHNFPWAFKTDITAFFDRIPRDILEEKIASMVKERSLHGILRQVINCEIEQTNPGYTTRISRLGIKRGLGVRQGMPLSPFFSNVLLVNFDKEVARSQWNAVRYADDLIFFCKSQKECQDVSEKCMAALAKVQLEIPGIAPGSKSSIHAPGEAVEFLGLCLEPHEHGYVLRLSNEQRQRIREDMLALGSVPELVSRKLTLSDLPRVISSKRNGYLAAYDSCNNLEELEHELKGIEKKVLRRVYVDELHIDLNSLSSSASKFLGLS